MSCPICGRILCDHSPYDRGQSYEQMSADMVRDEQELLIKRKENLSLEEAQELNEGERINLGELGVLKVVDPKYPVVRKGGRLIQQSILVETADGKQKLLIITETSKPSLVSV